MLLFNRHGIEERCLDDLSLQMNCRSYLPGMHVSTLAAPASLFSSLFSLSVSQSYTVTCNLLSPIPLHLFTHSSSIPPFSPLPPTKHKQTLPIPPISGFSKSPQDGDSHFTDEIRLHSGRYDWAIEDVLDVPAFFFLPLYFIDFKEAPIALNCTNCMNCYLK